MTAPITDEALEAIRQVLAEGDYTLADLADNALIETDDVRALIARIDAAETALERISRWEKHGGETPMVYPKDIALAYFAPPVSP